MLAAVVEFDPGLRLADYAVGLAIPEGAGGQETDANQNAYRSDSLPPGFRLLRPGTSDGPDD